MWNITHFKIRKYTKTRNRNFWDQLKEEDFLFPTTYISKEEAAVLGLETERNFSDSVLTNVGKVWGFRVYLGFVFWYIC